LQAGQALEQLHLLFVFQADVLLAGDGAAVDLVAAGRVQRETAHHEVLVITNGRIAFTHGSVIAQHLAEQPGLLILDQGVGKHRNRRRGIQQGRRLEATDPGVVSLVAAGVIGGNGRRGQFGVGRVGHRHCAGQQQAKGQQVEREPRGGLSLVESPVKHVHAKLLNDGQA